MDAYDEYIGFYDWEGVPCQILRDEENPDTLKAVAYHKGKGLVTVSLGTLLQQAEPISEARYKSTVLELIKG